MDAKKLLEFRSEVVLLEGAFNRIQKLLQDTPPNELVVNYTGSKPRAELKNKMLEARRDMIRLEKFIYGKEN